MYVTYVEYNTIQCITTISNIIQYLYNIIGETEQCAIDDELMRQQQ